MQDSLLSLPEIRDYVRAEFNQAGSSGFISNDDIDRWTNEAYLKYCLRLMKANQGYFESSVSLDITANIETIALPSNFAEQPSFLDAVILERVLSNVTIPLRYRKRYDEANSTTDSAEGDSYLPTYGFRGNNLVLEPTPTFTESAGLKLWYKGMPPRLRSSNAQAGAATTLTLDTAADPRDDYYNGVRVYIYSGTGSGQLRKITDYVGSTKVATADSSWSVNPDSTSVFSILFHDDFPEIFHMLMPLYASKKAFLKERSPMQAKNYDDSALKELESEFVKFIEERTDARKFVEPWHVELF